MHVSVLWVWWSYTAIRSFSDVFLIVCKYPLLFGSFLGCFSFKALDLGDFRGISKNKICGKGRGGCGAAGFFRRGKCWFSDGNM